MMNKFNNYNKNLKPFARKLRNNTTKSETNLWLKVLKARQLKGYQFLRQRPIGNYIVDFFCKELKLIIELDGMSHIQKEKYDIERENYLTNLGYEFLRISDNDVLKNLNGVYVYLIDWIENYENMHPEILKVNARNYRTSPSVPLNKGEAVLSSFPPLKGGRGDDTKSIKGNNGDEFLQTSFPPLKGCRGDDIKSIKGNNGDEFLQTSFPPLKGCRGDDTKSIKTKYFS
jgi:very-short-patch-repair endonuclease